MESGVGRKSDVDFVSTLETSDLTSWLELG
jgi:hypothetical protein